MTREQIDEYIAQCDAYLSDYRADDDPPAFYKANKNL